MADFAAVLKKTLDNMGETTPDLREKVYEKARAAIKRQIDAMEKTPPAAAIERQYAKLEEAIASIEAEYSFTDDVLPEITMPEEPVFQADEPASSEPEPTPDVKVEEPEAETDVPLAEVEEVKETYSAEPKAQDEPDSDIAPTDDEQAKQADDDADLVAAILEKVRPDPAARAPFVSVEADTSSAARIDPLEDFFRTQEELNARNNMGLGAETVPEFGEAVLVPTPNLGGKAAGSQSSDKSDENADDDDQVGSIDEEPKSKSKKSWRGAVVLAVLIIVGVGVAYAYQNQDKIKSMFQTMSGDASTDAAGDVPVRTVKTTSVDKQAEAEQVPADTPMANADDNVPTEKFTQRLTEDGTEVDTGPVAGAAPDTAEGSSVSPQTADTANNATGDATAAPAANDAATAQPASPTLVGQRAIFYEERTGSEQGTALAGATLWSKVNVSPGGDLPVELGIRAETNIPELGIKMEMTIRRNGDKTFPASHIIEIFFTVPETFQGRGIADVQRITFKATEQDPGNALIAVPTPLDQNIFMISLTDAATAVETNLQLMAREDWIDIPMQYTSGRRALLTIEKGTPGAAVFDEVLASWSAAPIN